MGHTSHSNRQVKQVSGASSTSASIPVDLKTLKEDQRRALAQTSSTWRTKTEESNVRGEVIQYIDKLRNDSIPEALKEINPKGSASFSHYDRQAARWLLKRIQPVSTLTPKRVEAIYTEVVEASTVCTLWKQESRKELSKKGFDITNNGVVVYNGTITANTTPMPEEAALVETYAQKMTRAGKLFYEALNCQSKNLHAKGIALYKEAARDGSYYAMMTLGRIYAHGIPRILRANKSEAQKWDAKAERTAKEAAIKYKDAQAMFCLGERYIYSREAPQNRNLAEGLKWHKRAAHTGLKFAYATVAGIYEDKFGYILQTFKVSPRPTEALRWYLLGEKQFNDETCIARAGHIYLVGGGTLKPDYAKARNYLRRASRVDYDAMYDLGIMNLKGLGLRAPDPVAAREWFRKASKAGSIEGKYQYAFCCENRVGGPRDLKTAKALYEALTKDSSFEADKAHLRLGTINEMPSGKQKKPNLKEALHHYFLANSSAHAEVAREAMKKIEEVEFKLLHK